MGTMQIRNVAVIGAGLMGHGIAQNFALAGFDVWLEDLSEKRIRHALEGIEGNLRLFIEHELIKPEDAENALTRIRGVTNLAEATRQADFVVEAVFEDLKVKQDLFGELERLCPEHAIFASNTSGLSVSRLAERTTCPERVIVAHHWNPPHIMTLVEVVPGEATSQQTVELTCQVLRKCGRWPVVLRKHAPGFIGVRLQFALFREAMAIVERGIASAEDVDTVVELTFGRRLPVTGPIKTADFAGLDIFLSICDYLFPDLESSSEPPSKLIDAVDRGHLGVRTGRGLYEWTPESVAKTKAARDAELIRWLKAAGR